MIKIEFKTPLNKIQREFQNQLSEKEILKTTAFAINETARKTIPKIKKEARAAYTIDKKYDERLAAVTKKAKGVRSSLYAEISANRKPTPLIGFQHEDIKPRPWRKGQAGGVKVEIIRGKTALLKHAFTATMRSGHKGIFIRGEYQNGKLIYGNFQSGKKAKITEIKSVSAHAMLKNKDIQNRLKDTINKQLPGRLKVLLQNKVNKLSRKLK